MTLKKIMRKQEVNDLSKAQQLNIVYVGTYQNEDWFNVELEKNK